MLVVNWTPEIDTALADVLFDAAEDIGILGVGHYLERIHRIIETGGIEEEEEE